VSDELNICGKKRSLSILRYYSNICLHGLRKQGKPVRVASLWIERDMSPGYFENEEQTLITRLWSSMNISLCFTSLNLCLSTMQWRRIDVWK